MNRASLQAIVTKLDLNQTTLKEAKSYAVRMGFSEVKARTKKTFIKELAKQLNDT